MEATARTAQLELVRDQGSGRSLWMAQGLRQHILFPGCLRLPQPRRRTLPGIPSDPLPLEHSAPPALAWTGSTERASDPNP